MIRLRSSPHGRWPSRLGAASPVSQAFGFQPGKPRLILEAAEKPRTKGATVQWNHFSGMMRRLPLGSIASVFLRMTVFIAPVLGPLIANAVDVQIDGAESPATASATQDRSLAYAAPVQCTKHAAAHTRGLTPVSSRDGLRTRWYRND